MSDISELLTVRLSAGELFERVKDEYPDHQRQELYETLHTRFPRGVLVRLVFNLPTIH